MDRSKKQKHEQQIRKSLKTLMNLQPQLVQYLKGMPMKTDNLLNRTYPYVHGLRLLRIFTLMEINYVLFALMDVIQKTKTVKAENVKIGIIGAGVMGRLILNTLLVFTRQGIKTQNILVSTRQPQHLHFYAQHFGIKTFFDNQKIAKQCDIIFVATPATLDNWILAELKTHLQARAYLNPTFESNRTSYASTVVIQHSQPVNQLAKTETEKQKKGETQNLVLKQTSKKIIAPIKEDQISLTPFVYILTSDITEQKSKKLFPFPVMVPWIRATEISSILQKIKPQLSTKDTKDLLQNSESIIKELQKIVSTEMTISKQKKETSQKESDNPPEQLSRIDTLINTLAYCGKKLENNWRLNIAFVKSKNQCEPHEIYKLQNEVLKAQGSYEETFLTKSRKWRMAYNNFVG